MKKSVFLLVFVILLTGCTAERGSSASPTTDSPYTGTTQPSDAAHSSTPVEDTGDWREAYLDALCERFPAGESAEGITINNLVLYDLDFDGVPEMLIDYVFANGVPGFYTGFTYKNGAIREITCVDGEIRLYFSLWQDRMTQKNFWICESWFREKEPYRYTYYVLEYASSELRLAGTLFEYDELNTDNDTTYRVYGTNGGAEDVSISELNSKRAEAFSGYKKLDAARFSTEGFAWSFIDAYVDDDQIDREYLMEFFSAWDGLLPYVDTETLLEENAQDILRDMPEPYGNDPLRLSPNCQVIAATAGDLDGDAQDDLAVVVEYAPSGMHGSRTAFVLLNENGRYKVKHRSDGLIMSADQGGVYGDPFERLSIENGTLSVVNYGGSSDRWGYTYSFAYMDGELRLIETETYMHSTHTVNGVITVRDYLNGTVETRSSCAADVSLDGLLLYSGTFAPTASCFESPVFVDLYAEGTPFAPSFWGYVYQGYYDVLPEYLPLKPKVSANDALRLVMEAYYPGLPEKPIQWTEETKANYEKLLFYEMPGFYYENEGGRLVFRWIEVSPNENTAPEVRYVLKWESNVSESDDALYYADGETGEILR